jgi:hypothetical protein
MSKFGDIINQAKSQPPEKTTSKARKPESQKNLEAKNGNDAVPENQKAVKMVNLSIKVDESLRRHWVAEAKRTGTSITSEIIEALNKKFGKP